VLASMEAGDRPLAPDETRAVPGLDDDAQEGS
jgi:hypothetical protein